MRIRITKINELKDALHPSNIVVGSEREGEFSEPILGKCFWMQYNDGVDRFFKTSIVTEIINDQTFKTLNSIYRHVIIND